MSFSLRRPLHARELTDDSEQPDRARDREIRGVVHLAETPVPRHDRVEQQDTAPRDEQHTDPGIARVKDDASQKESSRKQHARGDQRRGDQPFVSRGRRGSSS